MLPKASLRATSLLRPPATTRPSITSRSYRAQLKIVVRGLADHMAAKAPASRASGIGAKTGNAVCLRPSSAKRRQQVLSARIRARGHSQVFDCSLTADSARSEERHDESTTVTSSCVLSVKTRARSMTATRSGKRDAPKRPFSVLRATGRRDATKRDPAPSRGKTVASARGPGIG